MSSSISCSRSCLSRRSGFRSGVTCSALPYRCITARRRQPNCRVCWPSHIQHLGRRRDHAGPHPGPSPTARAHRARRRRRLGPRPRSGADRGREPDAGKLARAPTANVRLARLESRLGGRRRVPVADLVALLWIQSRMVFYIAAALGYDPATRCGRRAFGAAERVPNPGGGARGARRNRQHLAQAVAERALRSGGDDRLIDA